MLIALVSMSKCHTQSKDQVRRMFEELSIVDVISRYETSRQNCLYSRIVELPFIDECDRLAIYCESTVHTT